MGAAPGFGPSLVDGEILYLSVSQLERFDDSLEGGCQRKWWFRYVKKQREPQRRAQKLGDQVHAQVEHYLRTGQDVLGEVARAGKRFLPKPGDDLLVEREFSYLVDGRVESDRTIGPARGRVASPLTAAGIPLVVRVDLMHRRGEWVRDDGVVEAEVGAVAEVEDWKTSKQVESVIDDCTGVVVKRGWAKTAEQLAKTWQMTGYGMVAIARWPDLDHVRLGHGYFQTQGPRAASKRSALVTVAEIRDRWRGADALAERMRAVAKVERAEDVPANLRACGSYGGCAFKAQCPRSPGEVLEQLFGGQSMGLLDKMKQRSAEKVKVKPEVAAEIERLKAEEAGAGITPPDVPAPEKTHDPIPAEAPAEIRKFAENSPANCSDCGVALGAENTSRLPNGAVKHVGCAGKAVSAPSGECFPAGSQRKLTPKEAVNKKITCDCGAIVKVKPQEMNDEFYALVPAHDKPSMKMKVERLDGGVDEVTYIGGVETGRTEIKAAPAKAASAPTAATSTPGATATDPTPTQKAPTQSGAIDLYLDSSEDGVAAQRLEPYVRDLCDSLARQYKALDVRCAPDGTPLAFGKWKGAVAALARVELPPPGAYEVSSGSELAMVVFEALASSGLGRVVRRR